MELALNKPRVRVLAPGKPRPQPPPPAGARLISYFGMGCQLAVSGSMVLAVQADHLIEALRLDDLARTTQGWPQVRVLDPASA